MRGQNFKRSKVVRTGLSAGILQVTLNIPESKSLPRRLWCRLQDLLQYGIRHFERFVPHQDNIVRVHVLFQQLLDL